MIISLIAAVGENFVIGKNNRLLWYLPIDLQFFMKTTLHHSIIMGRKTFESLGKPLKNRKNIVVSSQNLENSPFENVLWVNNLSQAIAECERAGDKEVFVIGGGQIYSQALPLAHKLYLTHVQVTVEGDAYFPAFNAKEWDTHLLHSYPMDKKHSYSFSMVLYERKTSALPTV